MNNRTAQIIEHSNAGRSEQPVLRSPLLGLREIRPGTASHRFRSRGISWPPPLTETLRGLPPRVGQNPACQSERQHRQRSSSMGCRVGNRSSHRRSFRVHNDLPGSGNTGHPPMRSTSCNIPAANSDRRGECGRPATNHFEGIVGVPDARWTRMIFTTELARPEAVFLIEFPRSTNANRHRNVDVTFRRRSHVPVALGRLKWAIEAPAVQKYCRRSARRPTSA
jgi:hypothetical protein